MSYQIARWAGVFGHEYTDRNMSNIFEMEAIYKKNFGITRQQMNEEFLSDLDKDIVVLEVGCNVGNQLILLADMGFKKLYGIELSDYAFEIAKKRTETKGISFIKGSALDIPFRDGFFDMVFTSGVLIHIHPADIQKAILNIHKCSGKYIWGFEYYAESYQEVLYREHKNLLWKTDFAKLYKDAFSGLKLIKEKKYIYLDDNNLVDQMFLYEK
ncbi:pseudaminic acid biosynthesis-associated methylase [uncultured Candidatus Kuenenia sp.]|uniref:pseudaminic acid biosynthesis-associated methylase n=1 Tax=uncultured Candidatus Kuenenia sp. TaxID=1048336 RepID=UPI000314AD3D|nr:pseudaminic acid biosynthesis-associated methylase [uncultured Candidatus Kuenenia sp.]